jgi:hypothetical protein
MRYSRSGTDLDAVGDVMPMTFLGRGAPRTLQGRVKLSGLGFMDMLFPSDVAAPEAFPTTEAGSGFNWNSMIEGLTSIYQAKTQADLTRDLYELNLTRAKQGLAPIAASEVAPQVNVGVSRDVQNTLLMLGLGGAAILGIAYVTGGFGGKRRARRRR